MEWLAAHGFLIAFWATVFWGSVKLLDRDNVKNTFGLAVALGALFDLTHIFGIPDIIYLVAWLVFLVRLVMWHHDLGLLKALAVTAATVFGPYFLLPPIVAFVGDSAVLDDVVVYGFTLAVFGTWAVTSARARRRSRLTVSAQDTALPAARVERGGRKRAVTPPVVAVIPVVAAASVQAPPEPVAPRSDGGPTFLT
jgi:hypothetical protein